ncbi:hypothetical protein G5I_06867 [Acromyrmex echinatior]|uniref:Uncharacterized protein n=1 Tax=Acromyrmex echinatior TaxID=103372 RepID=F4WM34_ACREC|nr:hypothetical protein G5I_06867 [Acromyrmex echinatior]
MKYRPRGAETVKFDLIGRSHAGDDADDDDDDDVSGGIARLVGCARIYSVTQVTSSVMEDECTTVTQEGNTSAVAAAAAAPPPPGIRRLSSPCSHFPLSRNS